MIVEYRWRERIDWRHLYSTTIVPKMDNAHPELGE